MNGLTRFGIILFPTNEIMCLKVISVFGSMTTTGTFELTDRYTTFETKMSLKRASMGIGSSTLCTSKTDLPVNKNL